MADQIYSEGLSLSSRLWQISWAQYFPLKLTDDGVHAHLASSPEEIETFISRHFSQIYESNLESSRFVGGEAGEAKRHYYREMMDCFVFKAQEEVVGIFLANPFDWSTYYLRNCSLLPSHQGKKIQQRFLSFLMGISKEHGVSRLEVDITPSNLAQVHIFTKLGFNITGLVLSDRWGSLLRFSKYLNAAGERTFLQQFCLGVPDQQRGGSTSRDPEAESPMKKSF